MGTPLRWAVLAGLAVLLLKSAQQQTQLPPDSAGRVTGIPSEARFYRYPRESLQVQLAAAARKETHPDAVFLVPRNWTLWRLLAQRAVVVDRAFVFRADRMQAWHQRYLAVFDLAQGIGYPSRATERWLRELSRTIRFDYAVVPRSSCLRWRTVAVSGEWKLVAVES